MRSSTITAQRSDSQMAARPPGGRAATRCATPMAATMHAIAWFSSGAFFALVMLCAGIGQSGGRDDTEGGRLARRVRFATFCASGEL